MFGFLRPGCSGHLNRQYRQVYAALCAFQRANYGPCSAVFTSYEAVFLYHLCIEAGACQPPSPATPTCCHFRSDPSNRWQIDHEIARFCCAFAMVLAATKMEDDVRDSSSMLAKLTSKLLGNQFARAKTELDQFQPGLTDRIRERIAEHLQFEQDPTPRELSEYVQPTAHAFAEIFAALESTLQERPVPSLPEMSRLGHAIGAAIIAADCANDFERDRRTGEYNPLRGESDRRRAYEFALHELASAGWNCMDVNRTTGIRRRSVATSVLKSAFHRLDSRARPNDAATRRLAMARRGECDCIGDICCNVGCESAGCCCDGGGESAFSCCGDAANVCSTDGWGGCEFCICDPCCDCDSKGKRRNKRNADDGSSESDEPSDEQLTLRTVDLGESVGAIAPYGIVRIGNSLLPARSATAIRPNQPIVVTAVNWFGLDVQPANPVSVASS